MKEIKAGESCYLVPSNPKLGNPKNTFIEKVAREFFFVDGIRFNIKTCLSDNRGKIGDYAVYKDLDDYMLAMEAEKCIEEMCSGLIYKLESEEAIELYNKLRSRL